MISNQLYELLDNTKNYITNSLGTEKNNYNFYDLGVIVAWVDRIISYLENDFKNKFNGIKKTVEDKKNLLCNKAKPKSQVKQTKYNQCFRDTNNNKNSNIVNEKLDVFTSKDIQQLNNNIINEFTQFSANFVKDDDGKENKTLEYGLFQVANFSRNSYDDSKNFIKFIQKI